MKRRIFIIAFLLIILVGGSVWGAKTWKAMNLESCTLVGTTTNSGTISGGAVSVNAVSGTTGAFSGAVSGTSGTFSAGVSGTTGTFSSTVSGVAGTFSGAVSGTTGTFTDAISGTTIDGTTITGTGTEFGTGTISATEIADVVRYYQLPLGSFVSEQNDTAAAALSADTVPGLAIHNSYLSLDWADGEVTPATITFPTPSDYVTGGLFKVLATESEASTDNQIDFDVYINKDGQAYDSAATGQTPVVIAADTTTPDEVTLTVATDFASLSAGDWITLRIWRDDTATGTADMQVRGVHFYYMATQ